MSNAPYLLARTVARAMTDHLEASDTSVHWVQVVGESNMEANPVKPWPVKTDPMFNVMVQDGWSEGTLLYVYAQDSRYKPQEVVPILQIKMLGSRKRVCADIPLVFEVLDRIGELPLEGQAIVPEQASAALV